MNRRGFFGKAMALIVGSAVAPAAVKQYQWREYSVSVQVPALGEPLMFKGKPIIWDKFDSFEALAEEGRQKVKHRG